MAEDVRRIVAEFAARDKTAGAMASFTRGLDNTLRSARRLATGLLAYVFYIFTGFWHGGRCHRPLFIIER